MSKILATGPSGAGKTYLAEYFKSRERLAVDADLIDGLGSWYEGQQKIDMPINADLTFLETHEYLWDGDFLASYLKDKVNFYVFGMSGNVFDSVSLFDRHYFLDVPCDIILERLQHESRENVFGKTPEQAQAAVRYSSFLKVQATRNHFFIVDRTLSKETLFNQIT